MYSNQDVEAMLDRIEQLKKAKRNLDEQLLISATNPDAVTTSRTPIEMRKLIRRFNEELVVLHNSLGKLNLPKQAIL